MRIYDITADFSPELPVYGGDPGVEITPHYAMDKGQVCNLDRLSFGSHTGTHADAPKHFYDEGLTLDTVPPDYFCGPAKLLDLRRALHGRKSVEVSDLAAYDIAAGDILLLNTGNSPLMREKDFNRDYVHLSGEAACFLAERKIKTLGIDYLSIEAFGSRDFPAHKALLGSGIMILEGLVFDNEPYLLQGGYFLSALPLKIKGGNGSPVRAVLIDERRVDLAIFDMDGLMLDTEPISSEGWREAGRAMGYDFTPELFNQVYGCGYEMCKQRMDAYFGPGFDFAKAYTLRTAYTRGYIEKHGVAVKPGLHALLDTLEERGIKKCVATSTEYERAKHLLTQTGIFERFDAIIGGDLVKRGKPDPEIFLTAAARFDAEPCHCMVFEDSHTGAEAGYAGGMRVVLVPDLARPNQKTLAYASVVCADLFEAAEVVKCH